LTGIYIPVGVLPEAVQTVMKFIPASHGAVLMRQIFMEAPVGSVFAGAPAEAANAYLNEFGVKIYAFGEEISPLVMVLIIFGSGLLFMLLSVLRMRRRRQV
jgi:multidrug/hemolysin transport system permease protein